MREALVDHAQRGVREDAVRVHHVEVVVRQEVQPQVPGERQVRQLGLEPAPVSVRLAAIRMSGEMSMP